MIFSRLFAVTFRLELTNEIYADTLISGGWQWFPTWCL